MRITQMFGDDYINKEDVGTGLVLVIAGLDLVNIKQGRYYDQKYALVFENCEKRLILSKIKTKDIAKLFGDETDAWVGMEVELYIDPSVKYDGEEVGGIRIKKPVRSTRKDVQQDNRLWDVKDGKVQKMGISTADVHKLLVDTKNDAANIVVKESGAPTAKAITADQWYAIEKKLVTKGDSVPWDDDDRR